MPYVGGVNTYQARCREVAQNGYEGFLVGGKALQDGRERELADG